jgi:hypothetical protein
VVYWKCNPTKVKLIHALYRCPTAGSEFLIFGSLTTDGIVTDLTAVAACPSGRKKKIPDDKECITSDQYVAN